MMLKVLIVEDSEDDTIFLVRELQHSFDVSYERVETAKAMAEALNEKKWDIIISDYSMPRFSGLGALKVLKESRIDLPFIIVSGKIGEETAVEAMNAGVHDYILKDNMARLIPAVKKELEEAKERAKHREADRKLREYKKHLENLVKTRTSELAETNASLKDELSERKRAEQEINKQKKRYEELYQNAPDGYLSIGADKRIIEVNDTFLNMAGYPREDVVGREIGQFFESDIPFGKNFAGNLELGLRKKDNEILQVSVNALAIFVESSFSGSSLAIRNISEVKKLEKENISLAKDVIKLTKKIPLTENERIVLYSLVKYPMLNDVELSRKLSLKRSTITSIRNKLSREDFFFTCRIPNFSLIGCELITIINAKMNPLHEAKNIPRELCDAPEQVYLDATNNELAGVCISKNMTELKKHMDNLISGCEKNNIASNFKITYMPFETSRIERLFDCSQYLKKKIGREHV